MYPPTTSELSAGDSSSESSAGPSYKRCRSLAATMNSSIHASRGFVPSRVDLLPPRKRFRDSLSPEDSVEENIHTDVLADIEANATTIKVAVDMEVEAGVDASIGMEVDFRVDVEDEVPGEEIRDIRCEAFGFSSMMLCMDFRLVVELVVSSSISMTPEAIKELINQRVAEALATYEENLTAELVVKSQSQNEDDEDNRNVRGNRNRNVRGNGDGNDEGNANGNKGCNGNGSPNRNDRGADRIFVSSTFSALLDVIPSTLDGILDLVCFVVFGECRHRYAVYSLMDTVYCLSEYLNTAYCLLVDKAYWILFVSWSLVSAGTDTLLGGRGDERRSLKKQSFLKGTIDMDHEVDERQKISSNETHELLVCNIRRFEMIKYSFRDDEEYVAIKEDEYDDLMSTSTYACRACQEIFCMMDEGWMVTRDE
nr:hypothetical protein [Tanacetum cinerariifolium]